MTTTAFLFLGRVGQAVARARFEQHLTQSVRTVRRWPAWKQTQLGGRAVTFELVALHEPGPLLEPLQAAAERDLGAPLAHASVPLAHVPGKLWIVAVLDGEPVGCGALFLPEGAAELGSAYVLPEHRGRGIYSDLVDERLALCAGWPVVTAKCLPRAAGTLARRGFVEVGHEGEYAIMRLKRRRRRDPDWLRKIVRSAKRSAILTDK